MSNPILMHPVQRYQGAPHVPAMINSAVTRAAYDVYCHLYGEQEALITGWCRGGFGVGELLAFLYARSFPQTEWKTRAREAMEGMQGL